MKISYNWLKEYFDESLLKAEELANKIMLTSFEVEEVIQNDDDFIIDIDVLPNRGHDALCHYGIAKEISAITDLPYKKINFDELKQVAESDAIETNLEIEMTSAKDPRDSACRRYVGCVIENVKVGASPAGLKQKLESIGERSINNIVDITNYVMFTLGQPMHAFDKDKMTGNKIFVRQAKAGEEITTLDNKEVKLNETDLVIADQKNLLAIAGVKGGKIPEVDSSTKNIILESANFHPTSTRKTARRLNILTESSKRFEQEITPWLAEQAMYLAIDFVKKYASGPDTKIHKIVDKALVPSKKYKTGIALEKINSLLGVRYSLDQVLSVFNKQEFECEVIKNPRERAIEIAKKLIGKKHTIGASLTLHAPEEFDCSSLITYIAKEVGLSIPVVSIDQFLYSEKIEEKNLKPGDLIFNNSEDGFIHYESTGYMRGVKFENGIDHVGMYMGDGQVLHSSRYNKNGVEIMELKSCESFNNIVAYGRIFDDKERITVTVPYERLDIKGEADLVEEVGRLLGYINIPDQEIKVDEFKAGISSEIYVANKLRKILFNNAFSEILTYSFTKHGEVQPENPISEERSFLRPDLKQGFEDALQKNILNIDWLLLDQIRIFEIGKVFTKSAEKMSLGLGVKSRNGYKKIKSGEVLSEIVSLIENEFNIKLDEKINPDQEFVEIDLDPIISNLKGVKGYPKLEFKQDVDYKAISTYPFIARDIAVWIPNNELPEKLIEIIKEKSGALLVKEPKLFDEYKKDDKTSFAYRLIFQSFDRTLTDEEVSQIMQNIEQDIAKFDGWQIR